MLSAAFQPCIGRGLLAYWFSNFHALEKPKDWGVCLAMIRRALGPTRETCCCCCCCCFSFNLMQPRRMDAPLIAVKVRKGFEPLSDVERKQSHRQKHKEQLSSDQPQEKKKTKQISTMECSWTASRERMWSRMRIVPACVISRDSAALPTSILPRRIHPKTNKYQQKCSYCFLSLLVMKTIPLKKEQYPPL